MMYCSECGAEHSRDAKSCPKCGNPNPHVAGKLSAGIIIGIIFIPIVFAWFTLREGVSVAARVISFSWMTIAILVAIADVADEQTTSDASSSFVESSAKVSDVAKPVPAVKTSCKNLYEEFDRNEIRALELYGKKQVQISGRVTQISADFFDNPQIIMSAEQNDFGLSTCTLSAKKSEKFVSQIQKNQYISLVCRDISEVLGFPMAENCTMPN